MNANSSGFTVIPLALGLRQSFHDCYPQQRSDSRPFASIGGFRVVFVLALLTVCTIAGCSRSKLEPRQEFSLGTNGALLVSFDSQRRVRELRHFKPDQSLKLKLSLIYAERDIQQLLVFDPQDRKVWESTFTSNSNSGSGRSSDVPSPGWEIRMQRDWSGMPGDIHDTRSWFCGDDLLYRVHRTWPDDRSRVLYEVTGPSGVILFTNTYMKK